MPAIDSSLCTIKSQLFSEYNRGVMKWSNAVRLLGDHASAADFALLSRAVDRARLEALRAKSEYDVHITEHGCLAK